MTGLVPLWVGARGLEFDWKYIQMSFDANVSLVSDKLFLFSDFPIKIEPRLHRIFFVGCLGRCVSNYIFTVVLGKVPLDFK